MGSQSRPDTMKLSPLLTVAVVSAQAPYEECPSLADDLPAGVASLDCSGKKCKAVCEDGLTAMGKKAVTCKNGKWKGRLPECQTCSAPEDDAEDEDVKFVCKVKKGVNECKAKCISGVPVLAIGQTHEHEDDKLKMTCRCPKIQGSNEKECGWYVAGDHVSPSDIYCPTTTTTEITTTEDTTTEPITSHPITTSRAPNNSTTTHSTHSTVAPTTHGPSSTQGPSDWDWEDIVDTIQPGLSCGSTDTKIVGGEITDEHDYPWQVRLSIGGGLCGGTILSDRWVLTAAHCCQDANKATIFVSDYNKNKEDPGEFSVEAKQIILHPDYGKHPDSRIANDICLLRTPNLSAKKNADSVYAPACLPTSDYKHGEACHVSGWGTTQSGGSTSNKMREVGINLMSIDFCNDPKSVHADYVGATIEHLEMCAGTPDGDDENTLVDAGKDACQGDSGGPLTCVRDGQPVVAGVVSWGFDCAFEGQPGVYANTYHYTDWILATAEENGFPLITSSGSTVAPTTGGPTTGGSTTGGSTTGGPTSGPTTGGPTTGGPTTGGSTTGGPTSGPTTSEWEDIVPTIQPGLRCTKEQKAEKKGPPKIVGGQVITEHTYPWQVRLSIGGGLCGGTILSDRWVLTAAHCCDGAGSATIHISDFNMNKEDVGEFSVDAKKIIMHPDYGKHPDSEIANDICLLRTPNLDAKKNDDSVYAAACLPTSDYTHGEACYVSGWGTTQSNGNTSNKMREVGINLMSIDFCNDPKNVHNDYVGATIKDLEMCAGTPDGDDANTMVDAGKDACQGDSGGPLTCVRDGQPVVAGVVSWGFDCAFEGQPGVYANTYHYTDWILATAEAEGFPLQ